MPGFHRPREQHHVRAMQHVHFSLELGGPSPLLCGHSWPLALAYLRPARGVAQRLRFDAELAGDCGSRRPTSPETFTLSAVLVALSRSSGG